MITVLLLAGNFLREQRWFVIFLLLYVLMISSVYIFMPRPNIADLLFLLKQLAAFALLFSLSLVSGVIQNERRSRRLIAVLSKGVSRQQYIAAYLLGSGGISAIYCAGMLIVAAGLHSRLQFPLSPILSLIGVTLVACTLTNAVALFFSTMMHPFFAMPATLALLLFPFLLVGWLGLGAMNVIPVAALAYSASKFSLSHLWSVPWLAVWLALAESLLFWLAASWVFSKRNIAVAVE